MKVLIFTLILVVSLVSGHDSSPLLVKNPQNSMGVYFTGDLENPCVVSTDSDYLIQIEDSASEIQIVEDEELNLVILQCRQKLQDYEPQLDLIFPGTKWCGPGNISSGFDDLGEYADTDKCCRSHDYCPDYMLTGECKYGLCNTSPFTRSHCDCDDAFRNCLLELDTTVSNAVGEAFFNVGGVICYRFDYPIISCLQYEGNLNPTCVEYELDYTQPEEWQFFDSPLYRPPTNSTTEAY